MSTRRIQHESLQRLGFLTWPHPRGPWRAPSGSQGAPQTQSGCLLRTPPLSDGNTLGWQKIQGRETSSSLAWNSGHSQGRERPAGPPWGSPGYPSLSQQGRGKSVGLLRLQKKVLTLFKNPRFCLFLSFFFFFFKELSFHLLSWRRKKKPFQGVLNFRAPIRGCLSVSLWEVAF